MLCLKCKDGRVKETCSDCSGTGGEHGFPGQDCKTCHGEGEFDAGPCPVCKGTCEASLEVLKLAYAYNWVTRNHPDWDGDDADHPGVTMYSQAKWWRQRDTFGKVVQACGFADGCVTLMNELGFSAVFLGFAWGYNGEGPNGLATVLIDAGFFKNRQGAMEFVTHRPQEGDWVLTRRPE